MAQNYIKRAKVLFLPALKSSWLAHAARTGPATTVSLAIARLFEMPEAYWAPITTLIIMQSTLGASWSISKQRLIGTALGAVVGALLASYFVAGIVVFGLSIFVLGLICAILRLDQSAYRFAGITLAIVMLIERVQPPWIKGIHRFVEFSLGIVVGLVFAAVWPQRELQMGK